MASEIGLDGDLAQQNVKALREALAGVPSDDVITRVLGNTSEPAAANFTTRLEQNNGQIAAIVDQIRSLVTQNADALEQAAQALQKTDDLVAEDAARARTFVENAATDAAASGASGGFSGRDASRDAFAGASAAGTVASAPASTPTGAEATRAAFGSAAQ